MGKTIMGYVTYRCESIDCRQKFPWDPSAGFPTACPHCGFRPDDPDENVISMPAFLSAKTKANDQVARQMMDGSEVRAQLAAEAAGTTAAEMEGLKITNLRDNLREGDAAAAPVRNDVASHMDKSGFGGFGSPAAPAVHVQQAMGLAAQAHTGPDARAGARAMQSLQNKIFNV